MHVPQSDAQLEDVSEPPFILDMRIEPLPDMGERASDLAHLCLVAITSQADLLIYKSFSYACDQASSSSSADAEKKNEGRKKDATSLEHTRADPLVSRGIRDARRGMQALQIYL